MGKPKTLLSGIASAGLILCSSASAFAAGPIVLSDNQLDRVSAGGATVAQSSDAAAVGLLALTETTGNSAVIQGASPIPSQPQLAPTAGFADGTALAIGTNGGSSGGPPPATSTSVVTAGTADGNLVIHTTINSTVHGAGGVTFQSGWTFVYGSWVGF
jgi:hypothetical protein